MHTRWVLLVETVIFPVHRRNTLLKSLLPSLLHYLSWSQSWLLDLLEFRLWLSSLLTTTSIELLTKVRLVVILRPLEVALPLLCQLLLSLDLVDLHLSVVRHLWVDHHRLLRVTFLAGGLVLDFSLLLVLELHLMVLADLIGDLAGVLNILLLIHGRALGKARVAVRVHLLVLWIFRRIVQDNLNLILVDSTTLNWSLLQLINSLFVWFRKLRHERGWLA